MKQYSETLLDELNHQLEFIHTNTNSPSEYCEQAISVISKSLNSLRNFLADYKFRGKWEEIEFFKYTKPAFVSKLIYYREIYAIEANTPFGGEKVLRKYYNSEVRRLELWFDHNLDFCRYYRSGSSYLDKKYFLRKAVNSLLDNFIFQTDQLLCTSHDYKVAKIIANDMIRFYIEGELQKLKNKECSIDSGAHAIRPQKWTGSKVALIELLYALHSAGVFNNGNSNLKDIAEFFEHIFHVNLGQYHRTFLEIRLRKSERARFLKTLQDSIIRRMEESDA